jgi:hypothetical protein
MSTHDYVIANGSGSTVRADINTMALAIASNNSSGSDPSTTYAYQWYFDTGDGKMKMRNSANNAYITVGTFTASATTITQTDVNQTFSKAQRGTITQVNSTSGGAITLDMAANNYFKPSNAAGGGVLGSDNSGAYTLANPTNVVAGQAGSVFIVQDGTGSRTLGYGTNWHFAAGTVPVLTTTASAVDRLDYIVYSSTAIQCVLSKDIKAGS